MSRGRRRPHKPTVPRSERRSAPPSELPEYLRKLGVPPRRALGQHFLIDELILERIADACAAVPGETVLEIGAGPGGLTEELLARAGRVVAVELDEELAALTRARLAAHDHLTVLAADVLDFTPLELLEEAGARPPYVAVGNVPYYITQPIIRMLLESDPAPERIIVMVQREVARRIVGGDGHESLLSMSVKCYGVPRALFDVPAEAFWPAPKVQSAVIAIDRRPSPAVALDEADLAVFFDLLRAGFSAPRKQLHNALPGVLGLSDAQVSATLEAVDLDPALRAQHLRLDDWERLFHELRQRHPDALDVRR
ncbi:MAG: 16S rRNA (adenine(1518)-N(6)/adenine(1519)-N(6))-dimethyltransferase RsmA [Chloroflexi bacterium]|nr:16S rRNA (adenine(1518)-N(6)/adenine(1519)-N(6))-dimethyltransferase RsmA [Chloroflexota bacterium]